MTPNFDFEGHIDDDNRYEMTDELGGVEKHLTVFGFLSLKFGKKGKTIYRQLERIAMRAAETNGGSPGILFDNDGGQFVSFHPNEFE
jgi:hypothetical protein